VQALLHASVARNRKLTVDWVPAGDLEEATFKEVNTDLFAAPCILVDLLVLLYATL